MRQNPSEFKNNARRAVADIELKQKIGKSTGIALEKRRQTVDEVPEWEDMRARAHEIRRDCIENLEEHLKIFQTNARRNGIIVHYAEDNDAAVGIISDIVRSESSNSVIKSKSMITEELDLNARLSDKGVKSLETDLGEFIIQLAGETPSHIITPALHKSKEDVALLFEEHLHIPYTDDPARLTAAAREYLREEFLSASVSITGLNFACADTGSIVIVENEGNIRLCTVMPEVHIAVMSVDKVLPSFRDIPLFLKLLTRSASGQRITSYVSIINGPRSSQNPDGPRRLHVVILDGGRENIIGHPYWKESLYCIRCGACMNVCPVFQAIGGHAYGSVYPGPIGSVITPVLFNMKNSSDLPFASSLCGACTDICPVKIDIHSLLLRERDEIIRRGYRSVIEKIGITIWKWIVTSPSRLEIAGKVGWVLQKISGGKMIVPGWTPFRHFPEIKRESFRSLMIKKRNNNG